VALDALEKEVILYDYAIDSQGLIIRINEVDSQSKSQYKCIECDSEMIAKTGEIKEWHFAHKNIANCSGEGYLHKLAKRVFFENKSMQIISYKEFIFPMLNDSKGNLADVFDIWEYEKTIDKYRADILLSSSKHDYKVMIEIKVSHGLSNEKLSSGIPIIEINIQNQEDIENLKSGTLHKLRLDYHNILASKKYKFHTNYIIETKKTNCEYYKYEELKNYKSMVIDCIWYKQTKQFTNQCEFCSYYYE
jgi:competence CoiA-like predicted nuclease